jgi:microcystin degradation protein MlrC
MRFFFAMLSAETNTFTETPTGRTSFEEYGIFRGDASTKAPEAIGAMPLFVKELLAGDGHEMVESICAASQPNGPTVRSIYEELRDAILEDIINAGPLDAVFLVLHGGMVADGYPDCEGDLLARVRQIVGPKVPIGALLDLHCHLSDCMLSSANVIIALKEYPHIDGELRARELYLLLRDCADEKITPVTAVVDCPMVGLWHTTREPMASIVRRMQFLEGQEGVLSVSLGHGFPWGDVPEAGAKVWVITDGDYSKGKALAFDIANEFWAIRDEIVGNAVPTDAALDRALGLLQTMGGPIVIADVADNPGGGAPGDSSFVLRKVIERGVSDVVLGVFWDLGAVYLCKDAGVGNNLRLRIGGKIGVNSDSPVDLLVRIRSIADQHSQEAFGSTRLPFGSSVWVETIAEGKVPSGIHLVIASVRCQVISPDAFTGLGITLADKKIIIVKSSQHFYTGFAPISKDVIYASAPGAMYPDFANIPYRYRSLEYWPRVDNPPREF